MSSETFIIEWPFTFFLNHSSCKKKCFRENNTFYCYPLFCDVTFDEYDKLIKTGIVKPKQIDISNIRTFFK